MALEIKVLGPLEAAHQGRGVALGSQRRRELFTLLVAYAGQPVSTDRLVDALWPGKAPPTARTIVQVWVSGLRKVLADTGCALVTRPLGYELRVPDGAVDADRFERLVDQADSALADGAPRTALGHLDEALALWRGRPFADLVEPAPLAGRIARLEAGRLDAAERRAEALLAIGRYDPAVRGLEELVAAQPLRERAWGLLGDALTRSGRRAEAADARRRADEALTVSAAPAVAMTTSPADPAAGGVGRTRLPVPATPLIGRAAEIVAVAELLAAGRRVVTLVGPGGVGKTRLALAVAARSAAGYPGGVAFVPLAQVRADPLVPAAIARALGVRPGTQPVQRVLVQALRGRRVLLVVDNAEHLPRLPELLGALTTAVPTLTVLVTSRAVLHLAAEVAYPVPPLGLPPASGPTDPAALPGYDAVALFVARARMAVPGFAVTTANAAAVRDICHRLDGLPLAIELAAVRTGVLDPVALRGRLRAGLALLTSGPADAPLRHRTLRYAIDWSHQLLDPAEQRLFRRLAVFAGGCDVATVEAVCGAPVLETLSALVDKSLVQREVTADRVRFTMLETIREYADEKLAAAGERPAVERRLADLMVELAEQVERRMEAADQRGWLDRVDVELDNVRAVLQRARDRADATTVARIVTALFRYWLARGHQREEKYWLDWVVANPDGVPADRYATVQSHAAWLAVEYGDLPRAAELARASLRGAPRLSRSLSALGAIAYFQGEYPRASRLFRHATRQAEAAGDRYAQTRALANLATTTLAVGDLGEARDCIERAVRVGTDELFHVGKLRGDLALVLLERGDRAAAEALLRDVVDRLRRLDDRGYLPVCLARLGRTVLAAEPAEAARLHVEALELATTGGIGRFTVPVVVLGLAEVAVAVGEPGRAARLLAIADRLLVGMVLPVFEQRRADAVRAATRGAVPSDPVPGPEEATTVAVQEGRWLGRGQVVG